MYTKISLIFSLAVLTSMQTIQPIEPTTLTWAALTTTGIGLRLLTRVPNRDLIKNANEIFQTFMDFKQQITKSIQSKDQKALTETDQEMTLAQSHDAKGKKVITTDFKIGAEALISKASMLDYDIALRKIWPCNYKSAAQLEACNKLMANMKALVHLEMEKLEAKDMLDFFIPLFDEFGSQPFSDNPFENNSLEKIARKMAGGKSSYPIRDCFEKIESLINLLQKHSADVPYDQEFMDWLCKWHAQLETSAILVADNKVYQRMFSRR